ncbi:ABC transporter substrate-binding protein [Paenibacillus pasadenensis]|uniref:Vitamin B12 ABC transporter, B12-binding component BtuF n=1 Tax=Paenibacillus pasadenensis TaxID=217090 RepID=A0A2N5N7M9_9BACL|nr:ABC transporter substrate-binding protein [Paenibacillus pasadenensis]PLT46342.1 Vitamin B12 ABC transporter, B12-binding component BtuF [Paenibacillus pasadenensis]
MNASTSVSARFKAGSILLATLLLSACSANGDNAPASSATPSPSSAPPAASASPSPAAAKTAYPLTIQNFTLKAEGGEWEAKDQTFDKAPERVVVNTQPIAELMIKLGLADKLVGVAALYGELDPEVAEAFAKVPVLSKDYVSKEPVVAADPDLVMGRGGLFADADWGVGTVDGLNELGINTFVNTTSIKGATLDSLYDDVDKIGQIFDVQESAAAHVAKLKAHAESIKQAYAAQDELTFAFASDPGEGAIAPYSGITDTFQADALSLLKLKNGFADMPSDEASVEELVALNPDVLLVTIYTGSPAKEKTLESFYANEALKDISAIKNKRVYFIDFNAYWGYGDQIFAAVEKLGKELHP